MLCPNIVHGAARTILHPQLRSFDVVRNNIGVILCFIVEALCINVSERTMRHYIALYFSQYDESVCLGGGESVAGFCGVLLVSPA